MRPSSDDRRIPSLDGLRAISIAIVLISHLTGKPIGELGVRVFFVISGFLITTLLLAELERDGEISLRRFYLRRTFRIFPAYYAYLIAIVAAAAIGWVALAPGDAGHAFTYTTNYHPHRAWWIGHTWSLAVEEQFYLLWPALLLALGPRRGILAAASFVLVAPAIRLVDWFAVPGGRAMQGESFWTIGDAIAIGCVLAAARPRLDASRRWLAFSRSRWFALVPIAVVVAYEAAWRWTLPSLALLQTITIVGIAACIDWALRFPAGAVGRVLNARPLVFVGTLSYSLYLWQQPFLDHHDTGRLINSFPLNLVLAVGAALLSYYLIERPLLAARARIEARWLPRRARIAVCAASPAPARAS